MVKYNIDSIKEYHPALLTGNFESCAISLCRQSGPSPWSLLVEYRLVETCQTHNEICELGWQQRSEVNSDKALKTFQSNRLVEDGAIGICAAAFAAMKEGEIDEVTASASGVDYWVDERRAVLEISGIAKGMPSDLSKRHREKTTQLRQGSLFRSGRPGYVFVVNFGRKEAILSYET